MGPAVSLYSSSVASHSCTAEYKSAIYIYHSSLMNKVQNAQVSDPSLRSGQAAMLSSIESGNVELSVATGDAMKNESWFHTKKIYFQLINITINQKLNHATQILI